MTLTALSALAASVFGARAVDALALGGGNDPAPPCSSSRSPPRRSAPAWPSSRFRAFCIGLVVAGIASALIGLVQVFAPHAARRRLDRARRDRRPRDRQPAPAEPPEQPAAVVGRRRRLARRGEGARRAASPPALALAFIYVVVLSASRTGARRHADARRLGPARPAPVAADAHRCSCWRRCSTRAMWWATSLWATHSHQLFGGQTRFGDGGDISSSRFGIWSNTLALIASHPWLGVGFGDFNFAWTLTPFPGRPTEFFDHTHNLVLNFAVEMGVPLAIARPRARWSTRSGRRCANAIRDGREPSGGLSGPARGLRDRLPGRRAQHARVPALVRVLPAADGVRVRPLPGAAGGERGRRRGRRRRARQRHAALRPRRDVADPRRHARASTTTCGSSSSSRRRPAPARSSSASPTGARASSSATTPTTPPPPSPSTRAQAMNAFERAPHYLLDARLMMAWAKALDERGEIRQGALRGGAPEGIPQRPGRRVLRACAARAAAARAASGGRRRSSARRRRGRFASRTSASASPPARAGG